MDITTKKAGHRTMIDGTYFILHRYPSTAFFKKDRKGINRKSPETCGWSFVSEDGRYHIVRKSDADFVMTKSNLMTSINTDDYLIAKIKRVDLKMQSSKEHPYMANALCPRCSNILRKINKRWTYEYVCEHCHYRHY